MIEISETFNCQDLDCGRKFKTKEELLSHYERRHENLLDNSKNDFNINDVKNINDNKIKIITEEMIGIGLKYADLDEIEEIELGNKNISEFKCNKKIDFIELSQLLYLNISNNFIKNIEDVSYFRNLKILLMNKNLIEDLSPIEHLENLEILEAENNIISTVSSLAKSKRIYKLCLANNKLRYQISTMKIFQTLNFKELTIKNNIFVNEILGYKHLFIYKYPQLIKLDGEDINEIDHEIAARFTLENNQTILSNFSRPNTAKGINVLKDLSKSKINIDDSYIVNNSKISKLNYEKKNNFKPDISKYEEIDKIKKENEKLIIENRLLKEKVGDYENQINSLKLEIENLNSLKIDENFINVSNITYSDHKLKEEMNILKKDYYNLLFEFTNLKTENESLKENTISTCFSKTKCDDGNILVNKDYYDSEYERSISDIRQFKNKDMIGEEINYNIDNSDENDNIDVDIGNEIELLRKSFHNIKDMRNTVKILNESIVTKRKPSVSKNK